MELPSKENCILEMARRGIIEHNAHLQCVVQTYTWRNIREFITKELVLKGIVKTEEGTKLFCYDEDKHEFRLIFPKYVLRVDGMPPRNLYVAYGLHRKRRKRKRDKNPDDALIPSLPHIDISNMDYDSIVETLHKVVVSPSKFLKQEKPTSSVSQEEKNHANG